MNESWLSYFFPLVSVVVCNVVYHLLSRKIPSGVNPFAGLIITYAVACVFSIIMFFMTCRRDITQEISKLNIYSILMGFAVVGIEGGFLMMYRNGWEVSKGSLVANILLAVVLAFIGFLFLKEEVTVKKMIGIALCVGGVIFVNLG